MKVNLKQHMRNVRRIRRRVSLFWSKSALDFALYDWIFRFRHIRSFVVSIFFPAFICLLVAFTPPPPPPRPFFLPSFHGKDNICFISQIPARRRFVIIMLAAKQLISPPQSACAQRSVTVYPLEIKCVAVTRSLMTTTVCYVSRLAIKERISLLTAWGLVVGLVRLKELLEFSFSLHIDTLSSRQVMKNKSSTSGYCHDITPNSQNFFEGNVRQSVT